MISSAAARVLSPLPNHAPLKEGEERRRLIKHTRRERGTCLISEADGNIIGTAQGFYPAAEGRQVIERSELLLLLLLGEGYNFYTWVLGEPIYGLEHFKSKTCYFWDFYSIILNAHPCMVMLPMYGMIK